MVTGQLAAETAADALARGRCGAAALASYEARWRREIGRELADSLRIQRRLFARPALVDTVIRAAAADRRLCRLLADRKSTRLNSSHGYISYAVFCLKKK